MFMLNARQMDEGMKNGTLEIFVPRVGCFGKDRGAQRMNV